ncbi:MAG TPA: hypothetical protein VF604_02440 [Pyrinomonadaceae bacterium]|jgi:hypothetical protein
MTNKNGQQPMILLISKEEREECFFKQWLEKNTSSICEAGDIFQVIEEINDFTVRECPEVFLLEVETASQDSVEEMFYISSGAQDIQVLAYSKTIGGNQNSSLSLAA